MIAEPASRGLVLVATGVQTADEFTRCRVLGFSHFQGEFFARPRGESGSDGVGQGAVASLQALGELTGTDASFEDLERIIGADVGLSIALLRHVNSAFFALPRKIDTVREALTLLGTRAVRRWATVVALSSVPEVPDQLVALALLRARMCELLGGATSEEERDRLFTVGLFSVADALLDAPMEDVLATLPFTDEVTGALLRGEGRRGRILGSVLRYEQGHFPDGAEAGPDRARGGLPQPRSSGPDDAGRWLAVDGRMAVSLRLKLTLAFTGVMAVLLAISGIALSLLVATNLDSTIDNGLEARAGDAAAVVATGKLASTGEPFAQVLAPDGSVLDSTTGAGTRPLLSPAELARARTELISVERTRRQDAELRLVARPVARAERSWSSASRWPSASARSTRCTRGS